VKSFEVIMPGFPKLLCRIPAMVNSLSVLSHVQIWLLMMPLRGQRKESPGPLAPLPCHFHVSNPVSDELRAVVGRFFYSYLRPGRWATKSGPKVVLLSIKVAREKAAGHSVA
jgi:hypothetical protein